MTDQQLLTQYVTSRSDAAFTQLVNRHKDWLYSACLRRLNNNPHHAEDATQAVFLALAQKAPSLLNHPSLTSWLYRAAQFTALDARKREHRRSTREAEVAHMKTSSPDASSDLWLQIAPHLESALDRLPEKYRLPLLLRFYQKQTAAQIAAALHISEDAAQKRIIRALDRLRAKLPLDPAAAPSLSLLLSAKLLTSAPAAITGLSAASTTTAITLSQGALHMMRIAKLKSLSFALSLLLILLTTTTFLGFMSNHHETTALAADPDPPFTPNTPGARAALIAPYLNDNTFLLLHLDASLINPKKLATAITNSIAGLPHLTHPQLDQFQLQFDQLTIKADDTLTRFKQAGGRHIYILLSLPIPNTTNSPIILFPLEPGGDLQRLSEAIRSIPTFARANLLAAKNMFVICDPSQMETLTSYPTPRADLLSALAASTGEIQIAAGLTDTIRTHINLFPNPKLNTLLATIQHLTASISLPPNAAASASIQCDTEASAAALAQEWNIYIPTMLPTDKLKSAFLLTPKAATLTLTIDDPIPLAAALITFIPAPAKPSSH